MIVCNSYAHKFLTYSGLFSQELCCVRAHNCPLYSSSLKLFSICYLLQIVCWLLLFRNLWKDITWIYILIIFSWIINEVVMQFWWNFSSASILLRMIICQISSQSDDSMAFYSVFKLFINNWWVFFVWTPNPNLFWVSSDCSWKSSHWPTWIKCRT